MEPKVGDIVNDKYELIKKLGSGSMGVVFLAIHRDLRSRVAIKFISPDLINNQEARKRFMQEARIGANIKHPGVISVTDVSANGYVYIVMEYLRGKELSEIVNDAGCIVKAKFAIDVGSQILEALKEVHKEKIIHRDLKPANVFITDSGKIKIMDFGIAKAKSEALATTHELTSVGTINGTPYYMSPEQAIGSKKIDQRTDIWSVGVILYEMLTGCLPFVGQTATEILDNVRKGRTNPPRTLNPDISEELERVILKAMEPVPQKRYQNAKEFLADLENLSDSEHPAPTTPNPAPVHEAETVIVQRKVGSETQLSVRGFAHSSRQRYSAIAVLAGIIIFMGAIFGWQVCGRVETRNPVATPTAPSEPPAPPVAQTTEEPSTPALPEEAEPEPQLPEKAAPPPEPPEPQPSAEVTAPVKRPPPPRPAVKQAIQPEPRRQGMKMLPRQLGREPAPPRPPPKRGMAFLERRSKRK